MHRRLISLGCAATLSLALLAMPASAEPIRARHDGQVAVPARSAEPAARCLSPRPKRRYPRFGISLSGSHPEGLAGDIRDEERRFDTRIRTVRVFDPTIPPDGAWERRRPIARHRTVITSFRMPPRRVLRGRYDRALSDFFAEAPRRSSIYWSYIHEPEPEIDAGHFTARQYRRAFRHVARLAAAECRRNLYPTLILTGWTARPESGRDWRDYFPGHRYISALGWDPYNLGLTDSDRYHRPRDIYRDVIRISRRAGLPWGIAETGSIKLARDANGAKRGRWLKRVGRYLRKHHPHFVSYFQSTNGADWELRDRHGVRVWGRFMRRNR